MLYQIIISLFLSLFLLNLTLNLKSLRVPRRNAKIPDPAPLVSILVPARNEEKNIGHCLESLLRQDYTNFEVVVLDDNSEDATAEVVRRTAATDSRIRLVTGKPLPEGWSGKPYACYQAAKQARGNWLLFVDADTTHSPDMLRRTLELAIESKATLISGFPRQITTSLSQKIAVPMIYFILMSLVPMWWLHRSSKKLPSVAYGAFFLFPADAYWGFGGHEAVKSRILEDIWLGLEVSRHGGRHLAVDLSDVVACHMYSNLGTTWEGLTRCLYGVSAMSVAALSGLLVVGYITLLAPLYWLWKELFASASLPLWGPLVIFQVMLLFIMRGLVDSRFKESLLSTLLYPLGITFIVAVVIYGMALQVTGASVSWKKRVYHKTSSAE